MVEITSEQIVKIVVAVLVLVVVLGGVYILFKDKILSYFSDITPRDNRDFSSPYYTELLKPGNLVATLDREGYIYIDNVKTKYYIKKNSIKLDVSWWLDKEVGVLGKDFKISIDEGWKKKDQILSSIDGSEKIGQELRKIRN
jgi:hypothetical protein